MARAQQWNIGSTIPAPAGPAFITGVSASTSTQAGYFTASRGQPRLWVCDQNYGIVMSAGRWNGSGGGTYQQDYDNYCSQRAAQGINMLLIEPNGVANLHLFTNGNTWDNVSPWTNGTDAAGGLNPAYWTRVDYLLNAALANGITVFPLFDIFYATTPGGGTAFNGWTNSQFQAYGAAIGARYASQPNLMWLFGDDTFPTSFDGFFDQIRTGLAGAGDTHMQSALWESEYTSRYATDTNTQSAWGTAHAVFNSCYTYNAGYWIIEYAYGEVANQGASALLPVVWNDGMHYNGGPTYDNTWDRSMRQEVWWCLTAGARGVTTYDVHNYNWATAGDPATVTSAWFFANNLNTIVTAYQSWPEWYKLLPDLSSAFVTAGRGTRVSGIAAGNAGAAYEAAFTNSWVTASITPTGSLAVCYLPNSTTITCTTSMLATGWTAQWVDPITCATSSAGAGPTFNSTAKGSNSRGQPDWVLVFHP
jgi:hypothetical protein